LRRTGMTGLRTTFATATAVLTVLAGLASAGGQAQSWPQRPVR
jgi:hypothetical protein